jgi:enoyl-CoA hydratase/carnithine racemase
VGKAKAMDLVLRGRMMDAAEAERCGLVSQVVPADSLLDEAWPPPGASPALAAGADDAQGIRQSRLRKPLGEGLLFERRTLHTRASLLHDQKEGMAAFAEKRKARFEDR